MWGQVLGYAYEADLHCIQCTISRFRGSPEFKEYEDSEGNPVHPILSGQDTSDLDDDMYCGDCFDVIYEV